MYNKNSLHILPLLENTTVCTAEGAISIGGQIAKLTTTTSEGKED